jgi:TRAP-type C4-dicarboxylate transport system substrate-binding protein
MANKDWFDTLSPTNRALIRTAMGPLQDIRDGVRGDGERALQNLVPAGLIVHEPTAAERAAWKAAGQSTHAALIARLGGQAQMLYDAILAGKKAYAGTDGAAREAAVSR